MGLLKDDQKYEEKLLAKAKIIADSANRLWRMKPLCLIITPTSLTLNRNRDAATTRRRITNSDN